MNAVFIVLLACGLVSLAFGRGTKDPAVQVPDNVKSIIKHSCAITGCHAGKYPAGGHSYEPDKFVASVVDVPSTEVPSLKLVDTAAPEKSYLLAKIKGAQGIVGARMPANREPLTEGQIGQIEDWIKGLGKQAPGAGVPSGPVGAGRGPALEGSSESRHDSAQAAKPAQKFTRPAFWGTRLVNLPTTTTVGKGELLFRISHRFQPPTSSGWDSFYGLDGPAFILFSFGYGITDDLMVTVGRSRLYQEWELNADWAFLEQGAKSSLPFSATLHVGANLVSQDEPLGADWSGRFRLSALVSLAYQFNDRLSFLLVPAFCTNTNFFEPNSEGTFALGFGGRFTVFDEFSIIAEWVPTLAGYNDLYSAWGLGIEKKIGGHVFQVFITDSLGIIDSQYLSGGDLKLGDGDFRFGFNIFRSF
jgi:hypothetical protein